MVLPLHALGAFVGSLFDTSQLLTAANTMATWLPLLCALIRKAYFATTGPLAGETLATVFLEARAAFLFEAAFLLDQHAFRVGSIRFLAWSTGLATGGSNTRDGVAFARLALFASSLSGEGTSSTFLAVLTTTAR